MLKLQHGSIPRTHVVVQLGGSTHIFRQAMDACFEGKCVFRIYKGKRMSVVSEMGLGRLPEFVFLGDIGKTSPIALSE